MKNHLSSFIFALAIATALYTAATVSAQTVASCQQNSSAPAIAPYRWRPHSEVHVAFNSGQFKQSELSALEKALRTWEQELSNSDIRIRVINEGERAARTNESLSILVSRKDGLPVGRQAQFVALTGSNGYLSAGEIEIKKSVSRSDQLTRLLQHELGHAFGLMDCPSCRYGSTIMRMQTVSISGLSIEKLFGKEGAGLTACDRQSLVAGYQREPADGIEIPVGGVIGVDDVEDVVTKKDFDTTAPEVGDGKVLLENPNAFAPETTPAEQVMIDALLATETTNARALNNYTFKRDVLIETIGADGNATGSYHRLSQFVFDDAGMRIEKIISLPKPTLKHLVITNEDVTDLAGIQLIGWETNKTDLYRVIGAGRDPQTGQLLFQVVPRDLRQAKTTGARVFYGRLWVDEASMRIMRVKGRALPEGNQRFPVFETERKQIASGVWAPSSTFADETLVFPHRNVRMRITVRYFDYREFRSKLTITEIDSQ